MKTKHSIRKCYVSGQGKSLSMDGSGLRVHGTGLTVHGGAFPLALAAAAAAPLVERGVNALFGSGTQYQGGSVQGGFLGKFFKKAFSGVKKFVTSSPFKSAVRTARNFAMPHIRKYLPKIVPYALNAMTSTPYTSFAKPLVPFVTPYANKAADAGLSGLNNFAEKHGYGKKKGGNSVMEGIKYTKKQLNRPTKDLDKHSLTLLNNMMLSTPVKGRSKKSGKQGSGLMPL